MPMTTEELAEELESRDRNERRRRGLPEQRNTVTLDPALRPMVTAIGLRAAAERTVAKLRDDAHKLERMNHWDHARVVYDEIAHIEALLVRRHFFDLFADMLKETANDR